MEVVSSRNVNNFAHNQTIFDMLEEGDLVRFERGLYDHWGVYIGNGEVVHKAGNDNDGINQLQADSLCSFGGVMSDKAEVCIGEFWNIVDKGKAYIGNKDEKRKPFDRAKVVANAIEAVGKKGYNLIWSNCEHFANWCRYGEEKSEQVENVVSGAIVGALILGAGGLLARHLANKKKEKEKETEQHQY